MSRSNPSEEKFPLLLLFLEDGQRSVKRNKNILIDKGRYQGIASGASTVITQWPGHIGSCWVTATLIGISIVSITMLLLAFSVHPAINNLTAQCKRRKIFQTNESATIHLAHGPGAWDQKQLDILELIIKNYPQSQIELIVIRNALPKLNEAHYMYSTSPEKIVNKRDANEDKVITTIPSAMTTAKFVAPNNTIKEYNPFFPNSKKDVEFDFKIGAKKLFDIIFPKPREKTAVPKLKPTKKRAVKTLDGIMKTYSNIKIVNSTYDETFKNTPLYFTWPNTNEETRLFAVRVLQLWNYGGIGFSLNDMSEPLSPTAKKNDTAVEDVQNIADSDIKHMITIGISNYKNLPFGLVTVDDEGFHMETKTPCHAFLGELLIELKKAKLNTKPSDVIKKTLHRFCLRKAVDAHYCKTYDE